MTSWDRRQEIQVIYFRIEEQAGGSNMSILLDCPQVLTAGVGVTPLVADLLRWLSSCSNRSGWLFWFWFTNTPLRSMDQGLALWVLSFSAWGKVSLRISVQTASLWARERKRARWAASDTTSKTTHQTNKVLSRCAIWCVLFEHLFTLAQY